MAGRSSPTAGPRPLPVASPPNRPRGYCPHRSAHPRTSSASFGGFAPNRPVTRESRGATRRNDLERDWQLNALMPEVATDVCMCVYVCYFSVASRCAHTTLTRVVCRCSCRPLPSCHASGDCHFVACPCGRRSAGMRVKRSPQVFVQTAERMCHSTLHVVASPMVFRSSLATLHWCLRCSLGRRLREPAILCVFCKALASQSRKREACVLQWNVNSAVESGRAPVVNLRRPAI